jgi:uncharacterized protein (DUF2249 family)
MKINSHTKIGTLLRQRPDALEAIIGLSPRFEKLRNPLLRKIMANRTSISMACRMGGCTQHDFFAQISSFGFEADTSGEDDSFSANPIPDFILKADESQLVVLDVRPIIEAGSDPLSIISEKIKNLSQGQILKLINSFYPEPLVILLEKQGYTAFVESVAGDPVETYFWRSKERHDIPVLGDPISDNGFEKILKQFQNKLQTIDVRNMEMPQPMLTILDRLEKLPSDSALFVKHKKIPVFLLPELKHRNFEYRISSEQKEAVNLLIFRMQ